MEPSESIGPNGIPAFKLRAKLPFPQEFLDTQLSQQTNGTDRIPLDPAKCYAALISRSRAADGTFVYGVKSTKIYCRSVCPARKARRANVVFFYTAREAEAAGFRACKRCKPDTKGQMPEGEMVDRVKKFASKQVKRQRNTAEGFEERVEGDGNAKHDTRDHNTEKMTLEEMAKKAGVSKWHFWRTFKEVTGSTPAQYMSAQNRSKHVISLAGCSEQPVTQENEISWESEAFGIDEEALQSFEAQMQETNVWSEFSFLEDGIPLWDNFNHDSGIANTPETSADYEISHKLTIFYDTRSMTLGQLLVAFQGGKVCIVEQLGFGEIEASAVLNRKFPAELYKRMRLGESPIGASLVERVDELVRILESPIDAI